MIVEIRGKELLCEAVFHLAVKMHLPVSSNPGRTYIFLLSLTSHLHTLCCYTEQARQPLVCTHGSNGTAMGSLKMNSSLWKRHLEDHYTSLRHRAAHANFSDSLVWICELLILPPPCTERVLSLNGRNPRGTHANRCSGCIIYVINYGALNSLMPAFIHTAFTRLLAGGLYFLFFKKCVQKREQKFSPMNLDRMVKFLCMSSGTAGIKSAEGISESPQVLYPHNLHIICCICIQLNNH